MAKNKGKQSAGKPADAVALRERQSEDAEIGFINRQFAEHPVRGITPQRLHSLFIMAEYGNLQAQSDLFCDMEERDAHLYSEMSKRKRALLTVPWKIVPPKNASAAEKAQAEEVCEWFGEIEGFEDVILDALDAIGHAYSAQQLNWENVEGLWLPTTIDFQLPRHFQVPTLMSGLSQDEIRLRDGTPDGAQLWDYGWLVHKHKAKSGYLVRSGLHRVLAWPFLFKNYAVRDLAEFNEIHGLPLRLGKYPAGATPEEKLTLLRAVTEVGHNAAGIIPQSMTIEFEEAAKGTSDPYQAMIKWAELSMSKAILGGTLTTQADGKTSTNALGSVHNEVRKELTLSDSKQIATSINRDLIGSMMRLNRPNVDPRRYPKFTFDFTENADLAAYADALPKLVGIGMQIPEDWANNELGIPLPQPGQRILTVQALLPADLPPKPVADASKQTPIVASANSQSLPTGAANNPSSPPASSIEDIPAVKVAIQTQTELDAQTANALDTDLLQPVAEGLLTPILDALTKAGGYNEALTMLAELSPNMDMQELQDELAKLGFAAEVWGRLSAQAGRKADQS